jgi:hypothetical protein
MAFNKSNKPGAAKYPKMSNKQTMAAVFAMKNFSAKKPMMRASIKKK